MTTGDLSGSSPQKSLQPVSSSVDRSAGRAKGLLGIGMASVIWGTSPLFVRWAGSVPLVTVFWRVAFGSAALLAYVLLRGEHRMLLRLSRRTLLGLALVGVLVAGGWVALFTAYSLTTVATAVLLNYMGPVIVAALTPAVTHVARDRRIVVPLVLALAGTVLIVGPQALGASGSRDLLGVLLATISAVLYGASVLMTKRLLEGVPPGLTALCEQSASVVVLLPALLFLPGPVGVAGWASVVALGLLHSGLAVLMFFGGLRQARADQAAVLTYIEPVAAVIFAVLLLNEALHWFTVVGGAAVVAGGIMVARLGEVVCPELPPPGPEQPKGPRPEGLDGEYNPQRYP